MILYFSLGIDCHYCLTLRRALASVLSKTYVYNLQIFSSCVMKLGIL